MKLPVTMILPAKAGLRKMVKFQWGINKMDERSSEPPHFLFFDIVWFWKSQSIWVSKSGHYVEHGGNGMDNIKISKKQQEILDTRMALVMIRQLKKEGVITGPELKKVEEEAANLVPDLFEDHGEGKVCY